MWKIQQVADLTGVTVRALRHYDKIGLLPPAQVTEAGYRLYGPAELDRLQQILFFRELEFPLAEIKAILACPSYDRQAALAAQRDLLQEKRKRLDGLLSLVEDALKGEGTMQFTPFDNQPFEKKRRAYAQQAEARWGTTAAWRESQQKTKGYDKAAWAAIRAEEEKLFTSFAACRHLAPEHPEVQALVARWQAHITRRYYRCTPEILAGLGQMYLSDDRFRQTLDAYGQGTARLMSEAIEVFCAAQG